MKKYILLFILAVISLATTAQTTDPNRLLVTNKLGSYTSYNIDDIDSIGFATVEGAVAADVKVLGFTAGKGADSDTLWLEVTKTPSCYTYKILVLPTNTANQITNNLEAEAYMNSYNAIRQWDDYTNAQMTGFDKKFKTGTSYTVVTVGHDGYDTPCDFRKAEFTTPDAQLVGNPTVTCDVVSATATSITCKFTPNADVKEYTMSMFDHRGGALDNFAVWGPMFGLECLGDFILQNAWYTYDGEEEHTWSDLLPGHEYEIAIQAWDANGQYAPVTYAYVSTEKKGGEGEAKVDITIGEFGYDAKAEAHYQWIKFTPNDQTAKYHAALFTKRPDGTEWTEDEINAYLKSDNNPNYPPMFQDPYWDMVEEDNDRWSLEPNTTYTAAAIAINANNEWGPLTKVEFTTPEAMNAAKTKRTSLRMPERQNKKANLSLPAMAPRKSWMPAKKKGIELIAK